MAFRIGQKVCCIDDSRLGGVVVCGPVYTVSAVMTGMWRSLGNTIRVGLCFAEVSPPDGYEAFNAELFRPVVERKTDISALVEIARLASQRGRVDA